MDMHYTCHTIYDQSALTAMARALRKTVLKKSSRRWWVVGWLVTALGVFALLNPQESLPLRLANLAAVILVLVLQFRRDSLRAWLAKKRALPGTELCSTSFYPDYYECKIAGASTRWSYDKILRLVDTKEYIVFAMGKNYAQVYQKSQLKGGSVDSFSSFLEQKTGKAMEHLDR